MMLMYDCTKYMNFCGRNFCGQVSAVSGIAICKKGAFCDTIV